ncbi:MAG TPA: hypothetical protein VLN74_01540 [Ilumatobacteraceae bacterium]|nr:hypothetical protein [Ilumatobacteraceae bacterium]
MFFWFIGTAIVTVGVVFRDPRFDYRLLIVGSVLPIVDGVFGGARALHSVTVSVALLGVLMIATSGRKPIRKVLLGLPIGMILHLVFDGAWSDTEVFWWPFFGLSFDDAPLPMVARGWWSALLEAAGVAICVWLWRRNELGDAARRAAFRHDGRLDAVPERLG